MTKADQSVPKAAAILRRWQVEQRLGIKRSTIYDKMDPRSPRYDAQFPRPIRLGGSAIGWLEAEVDAWLQRQIRASREVS